MELYLTIGVGMPIFSKGLVIGFLIALPVGPVAIVCIRRTLTLGKRHGLMSGLGAATADALYGALAALGLTWVSGIIEENKTLFFILGGTVLCLLGARTFLSQSEKQARATDAMVHAGNFISTFFLTLMNPMTVLAFMAIFASSNLSAIENMSKPLLILGVFLGSGLWWITLSLLASIFRTIVNEEHMGMINRIAGTLIVICGVLVMLQAKYGEFKL
jgi:threonine/homoserine/homoserine lactone efflux protein